MIMDQGDQLDKIEQLKKRLYGREQISNTANRSTLSFKKNQSSNSTWVKEDEVPTTISSKMSWLSWLVVGSALFFVATLGVAGYILISGSNVISNRNIDFSIKAPVTVKAGDEIPVQISIANRNKLPLEQVKLIVSYPDDTRKPGDASILLTKTEEVIGVINSGQIFNQTSQAVLFGREDDVKRIKALIEYRIPGSNAVYSKEADVDLTINSPPIDVNLSMVPEVIAGQDVTLEVKVSSNADLLLKNVALNIDYPSGFKFTNSTLDPSGSDNFWFFGDMKAGEEKVFKINGSLSGQSEEVKTFEASIGSVEDLNADKLDSIFANLFKTVTIKQPFVAVNVLVNGKSSDETVVKSGDFVKVDVEWINNLNIPVTDNQIEVFLDGEILDEKQVQVENGFYYSQNNRIVWNKNTLSSLKSIDPKSRGKTSFYFKIYSLSDSSLVGLKNPSMNIKTRIISTRVSEGFNTENIVSSVDRILKMQTAIGLSTKVSYKDGPNPPVLGSDTNYSITLTLINSSNNLKDSKIFIKLPIYIKWLGVFEPKSEFLSYNQNTSEVVWNIGDILPGTGQSNAPKEITFDIAFSPSLNQIGDTVTLLERVFFKGFDTFTETMLEINKNNVNNNTSL